MISFFFQLTNLTSSVHILISDMAKWNKSGISEHTTWSILVRAYEDIMDLLCSPIQLCCRSWSPFRLWFWMPNIISMSLVMLCKLTQPMGRRNPWHTMKINSFYHAGRCCTCPRYWKSTFVSKMILNLTI